MSETVLTILVWLAFFGGLAVIGTLTAFIVKAVETKRRRRGEIIFLYSEHYKVKGGEDDGRYFHF